MPVLFEMLLYPSCLKTLSQFSLNADKRNMLEEMTGQLREEVSGCSVYLFSGYFVFGGLCVFVI